MLNVRIAQVHIQPMTTSYLLADSFLVETTLTPDSLSLAGLEQAFLLVRERLRSFASDPAFSAKLAFGGSFDGQAAQGLVQAWEKEGFGAIPTLEVISGSQLNGAIGAFAVSTNRIYLSEEFLVRNRGNLEAIAAVLLEEYGHYLDVLLNGGLDSAGDEGAIFAAIVLGESLSDAELGQLKAKNDHGTLVFDGVSIAVERANIRGDDGNNTLTGTNEADLIEGLGGNDTLDGLGGNDTLDGGTGTNSLSGGEGDDVLISNFGNVNGGIGDDTLNLDYTNSGLIEGIRNDISNSVLKRGTNETLLTYSNFEQINLTGTSVNDILSGGISNIRFSLQGGAGNDTISGGAGDILDGGEGTDVLTLNLSNTTINWTLNLNTPDSQLQGDSQTQVKNFEQFGSIITGSGNDSITESGAGNTTLNGGEGNDSVTLIHNGGVIKGNVNGGIGDDTLNLDYTNSGLIEGIRNDISNSVLKRGTNETLLSYFGFEQINLTGTSVNDILSGFSLNDTLIGGSGNDTISGGGGNDQLSGVNAANAAPGLNEIDILRGDAGSDKFILGDESKVYYNDRIATTIGTTDYARIADLNVNEDLIQLKGLQSDYILTNTTLNSILGTGIFLDKPAAEPDELIAFVEGVTGLAITSSVFVFVGTTPILTNDTYSIDEDTALNVDAASGILSNDTGISEQNSTINRVINASKGTLTLNNDGSFNYIPNANFNGTDTFTYRVSNGTITSDIATVTLTVNPVNDAPVAIDDSYSTLEDTPLVVSIANGVRTNDSDIDGNALSVALVNTVTNGSLSLNNNGAFTYTPNANFSGTDSFTYRINDGLADSNLATVTINVNENNDPPVANNDSYSLNEDNSLFVNVATGVLSNDTDVDGNPLTATLLTSTVNGGLTLNANGSFTYTPNTNFNGTDSFTYQINDGSLTSNTATVTLTINSLNDAPVATNDAFSTEQNQPLTIAVADLLTNDTDIENNPLTITGVSNAVNGIVSLVNSQITFTPNPTFSGNASFQYAISDGQGGTDNATVNITVNPPVGSPGSLSFSTTNYSVAENGAATVNIFRSNGTTGAISATLLLIDGTATAPSDYNGSPIIITFNDGEANKTVILPIVDDTLFEGNESLTLALSNPTGGATLGGQSTAILTIIDNEVILNFSSANYTVREDGTAVTQITVTRTGNPLAVVGGTIVLTDGTAQGCSCEPTSVNNDFHDSSISFTLAANELSKVIAVESATLANPDAIRIRNDAKSETNETFTISLTNLTGAANLGDQSSATITILDDDAEIAFSSPTFTINENGTPFVTQVVVTRTGGLSEAVGATVTLTNGTATAPADYTNTVILVSFAAGETSQIITIPIVDDSLYEPLETINLTLTSPTGGVRLGSQGTAVLRIVDNDANLGSLAFNNANYSIGEDGTTTLQITVFRTGGSDGIVGATIIWTDGTATAPNDYIDNPIAVIFANGETSKIVNIPIVDNTIYEPDETLTLTLTDPTEGATLGTQITTTLNIVDNDFQAGTLGFSNSNFSVNEDGTSIVQITILRTGGNNGEVSATLSLANDSAIAPNDYDNSPITVTFADGETSKTIRLPIVDDNLIENNETLNLTLSNPTNGANLGIQNTATLTIIDNDTSILAFSNANYSVDENGTPVAEITVTRTGRNEGVVTAIVLVTNGSATTPDDFNGTSIAVRFENGETTPKVITIPIIDDAFIEGNETINLRLSNPTGSAKIGLPATAVLTILDNDVVSALSVNFNAEQVTEGNTLIGTVTRNRNTNNPLTVSLRSSDETQLNLPATVTIPVGATTATFSLGAIDDQLIERTRDYNILATASGYVSGTNSLTLLDNDQPTLTLALSQPQVVEGTNNPPLIATITRDRITNQSLVVLLSSNHPNLLTLPEQITIPANQASTTFSVNLIDNSAIDGNQPVTLTATPTYTAGGAIAGSSSSVSLTVLDDEVPALTLSLNKDLIGEKITNNIAQGIISRNVVTAQAITITLTSSDTTEATVPLTVIIPANQSSATFTVTGVDDLIADGEQPVSLTASASGFLSGSSSITVTDLDVPDLKVTRLTPPAIALSGKLANLGYRVVNQGLIPAVGSWVEQIYLSSDQKLDLNLDSLLAEIPITANLPIDTFFEGTVPLFLPRTIGQYWLIAVTDADNNLDEGTGIGEANNTTVLSFPILPAYRATVSTETETGLAGSSVILRGQAISTLDASPVPFEFVTIVVERDGILRTIDAFTDQNGNFVNSFKALPNEGGQYQINAYFPGNPGEDTTPEDSFNLIGMRFESPSPTYQIFANSPFSIQTNLQNLSNFPLTGLSATVEGAPSNWTVQVTSPSTLEGSSKALVNYTVNVGDESILEDEFLIRLTSAEGATTTLPVKVTVNRLVPRLVSNVETLTSGMLRGQQTPVEFTITNTGGVATGDIQLILPSTPWLSFAANSNNISSLSPNESATITLLLTPDSTLPLGPYQGNLRLDAPGNDADLSLPFTFKAVSSAIGAVQIDVVDELTFFTDTAPKLANATVVLRDAFTNEEVTKVVTSESGSVLLENIPEGNYILEVRAKDHSSFRRTVIVQAGQQEAIEAFLSKETVKYIWRVEETGIEDRTRISIESVFQTNVPIPTITVDPPSIDFGDLNTIGQVMQVNLTLTNHGLIATNNVKFVFENNLFYKIEPIIQEIGILGAKSSITVPVRITRIADFDTIGNDDQVPCNIEGGVNYSYSAGEYKVTKKAPITLLNTEGNCKKGSPDDSGDGNGDGDGSSGKKEDIILPSPPFIETSVDVKVRIRIDQDAVMTRSAFLGTLELENSNDNLNLKDISVVLEVRDANGNLVNNLFGIRPPVLSGISAVDGTGVLNADTSGSAEFTIIPTTNAAPEGATGYTIGGVLSYTEGDKTLTVRLEPASVSVLPQAELHLDYFQQRDVFGDDPFTDDVVEISVPFVLGVLVRNEGKGEAKDLQIISSQPKIIENEQGLLINFEIVGSRVGKQTEGLQSLRPSLQVNFGDLKPGETAIADWLLKSSLEGKFIEYEATFEHLNDLGVEELSLIKSVKIHELIHQVLATRPGDDQLPDFLVNDEDDPEKPENLPDTLYLSDGTIATVNVVTQISQPISVNAQTFRITATTPAGWTYIKLADPSEGKLQIQRILRSDGQEINLANIWQSDRTFPDSGRPIKENTLHLLDFNSTGSYTLYYGTTDKISPQVVDLLDISPDPRTNSVTTLVDVVFSEPIKSSSFDYRDIVLTRNGSSNLITSAITVLQLSETSYRINGLANLTTAYGDYTLTVSGTGIEDLAGNRGTGSASDSWKTASALAFGLPEFSINEDGNPVVAVTVVRTGTQGDVGVTLVLRNGLEPDATNYSDPITINFADGQGGSRLVTIPVTDDDYLEPDQIVYLTLVNPTRGAFLGQQNTARLKIIDNESVGGGGDGGDGGGSGQDILNFSAPTYSIAENGTPIATVTITRMGGTNNAVSATINLTDGTAKASDDFSATPLTVNFAARDITPKTVNIPLVDDSLFEGDEINETINLSLNNPTGGATLGTQTTAIVTIIDDDPRPTVSIAPISLEQKEGNSGSKAIEFIVSLSNPSAKIITVPYTLVDGTASAGSDFSGNNGTLTFAAGTVSQTITVDIIGDTEVEEDESFTVELGTPTGATLDSAKTSTVVILKDDRLPTVSISPLLSKQQEGNSGTQKIAFTVSLSEPSAATVTVPYILKNDTALAGSDFIDSSGTLTFAAGTVSQTITVDIIGDTEIEENETFKVELGTPTGAKLGNSNTATGVILNDENSVLVFSK